MTNLLVGSISGMCGTSVIQPIDMVKVRIQLDKYKVYNLWLTNRYYMGVYFFVSLFLVKKVLWYRFIVV